MSAASFRLYYMMDYHEHEKPRLVSTGRGFSVLYRNKYLYSKYDPQRAITAQAASLHIPDFSLILCFSPVLGYGLKELMEKVPASSFIIALECDQSLMRLSLDNCEPALFAHPRFSYVRTDRVAEVIKKIEALPLFPFKKCITLACSGGVQLYQDFYDQVRQYANELISRFWINHLTLIQLGRNYARNTFRNLRFLLEEDRAALLKGTERITKPILIAGAGTSLDSSRDFIIRNRKHFFLLAVDAAVAALMPDIQPDAIMIVESQYWIDSAFIGLKNSGIPVFADLTASPRAVRGTGGKVYFFCTSYARLRYLQRLYTVMHPFVLPPLGSVGLTALRLAVDLSDSEIPVFHTGLDFAWGNGLTHAKDSSPVKQLYAATDRTESLYKLNIPVETKRGIGKQGLLYWTSPVLAGYAELYRHLFNGKTRIIDIGTFGFPLTDQQVDCAEAEQTLTFAAVHTKSSSPAHAMDCLFDDDNGGSAMEQVLLQKEAIRRYLATEYEYLAVLNAHLQGDKPLPKDIMEQIIADRDYLYGHFPDSARGYSLELGFLKRLRIELAYMLKIFDYTRIDTCT